MNVLLIYPKFKSDTFWEAKSSMQHISRKKAWMTPLGLLTVASYLPDDFNIRLIDRMVREETEADSSSRIEPPHKEFSADHLSGSSIAALPCAPDDVLFGRQGKRGKDLFLENLAENLVGKFSSVVSLLHGLLLLLSPPCAGSPPSAADFTLSCPSFS